MRTRGPSGPDLEWRERARQIRAAARKGKNSAQIADLYQLPVAAVERVLAPAKHPRLSDPVDLIRARREAPGMAPAGTQLYWLGFLTAAGYIASLTLVVTLGEASRDCIEPLLADLATERIGCEFCHSSIVGWQAYVRDQDLCKALFPWGIPSDLHGDDPALLDDLPKEFVTPFVRGYVDGNVISRRSRTSRRDSNFTLQGTPAVLTGINSIIQRYWEVPGGTVTQGRDRAELRFSDPEACRAIHNRLDSFASRVLRTQETAPRR